MRTLSLTLSRPFLPILLSLLLLLLSPLPTTSSSSPTPPTIPYLGLFSNPSSATPGQSIQLTWLCYFCLPLPPTSFVSLSLNSTTSSPPPLPFFTGGAINGSTPYTVPLTLTPSTPLTLTASLSPLPPSSLTLPLRTPSPSLTLTRPSPTELLTQRTGLTLEWLCTDCYQLTTVSIAWRGGRGGQGVVVSGMRTTQSGWVMPLPREMMGEDSVTLTITSDLPPHLTSSSTVAIARSQ